MLVMVGVIDFVDDLQDDITDWCRSSLPEAVQLASDREKWRGVVGLNGPPGP